MIIKTRLVPAPYWGITLWPFVFVVPWADDTVVPHEMVHYRRQAWWSPIWWLLYLLVPSFRLREEVLAYQESVKHGMSLQNAAKWLTTYRAGVSYDKAVELLQKES